MVRGSLLLGFVVPALVACGRPETVADRHVAELSEEVSKLEADRDAELGRLDGLDSEPKSVPSERRRGPANTQVRAVQLGAVVDEGSDDPDDKTERPDIRVVGNRVRPTKSGRSRADVTESSSRSSVLDPEAKENYEAALALVQGKQHARALEAFRSFLVRWPDHPYAENAMYWQGEAHFALGEYLQAGEQFEGVLSRFGSGKKAPDALLKLGMCQERLGAPERASEYFRRLKTEYPKSDAAKRIPAGAGRDLPKGSKENR